MITNTTTPAPAQFTNAGERSQFLNDAITCLAGETGLNRADETQYQQLYNMAIRANPALAAGMKRSAFNAPPTAPAPAPAAIRAIFVNAAMAEIPAAQFTNAGERSQFLNDAITRLAGETGLNRADETQYQQLYNMAIRANPALASGMKRSAMNAASERPALSTAQKAQFLNAEIDCIAAARGITDPVVKKASQGILRKLALERRPDLVPKRSADFECKKFSVPPPLIGSHGAYA